MPKYLTVEVNGRGFQCLSGNAHRGSVLWSTAIYNCFGGLFLIVNVNVRHTY